MSALTQEKEIMARTVAIAIIRGQLPAKADDILQAIDDDRDRAFLAMHLEEAAEILALDKPGALIESAQQEAALVALQGRAYKVEKAIEELRKRLVKPRQDEIRAINSILGTDSSPGGVIFGPLLARMGKNGDADLRMAAWRKAEAARIAREKDEAAQRQIEAARREEEALERAREATDALEREQAKREAAAAARDLQFAEMSAPRDQVRGVKTEDGKKTYLEEWTFEVVDSAQVPREFLMVDVGAIRAAVKAGRRQVPGVNVFQVERSRRGV